MSVWCLPIVTYVVSTVTRSKNLNFYSDTKGSKYNVTFTGTLKKII